MILYNEGDYAGMTDEEIRERICSDFECTRAEVDPYDFLILYQEYEDYTGTSFIVMRSGDEFYVNHGGHCSCYGFEGQWDPERVSIEYLKRYEPWYGPPVLNKLLANLDAVADLG